MLSRSKGSQSATTQVKVLSSEIIHIALGQGVHFLETEIGIFAKGENISSVPESESVAGRRIDIIGTWENQVVSNESRQRAEDVMRWYGDLVVGLTHSRGVNRVMPIEFQEIGALEGVSSLTMRGKVCDAVL
jgi:hypothetical protein